MPDGDLDALAEEFQALGRSLRLPAPPTALAAAVMTRVVDLPSPTPARLTGRVVSRTCEALRRHRRRAVALVFALLLSLMAAPPVRAAMADWFSFGGVIVRITPTPSPSSAPPAPTIATSISLEQAKSLVSFAPLMLTRLGPPQGIEVSQDRRVLSMTWTTATGPVRLDQFDSRLDYTFAKSAQGVEFTEVGGQFALWFDKPHEVAVLNADGTSRTENARLAGHTLIWERNGTTLRLEAELSEGRAIEIAESAGPVP